MIKNPPAVQETQVRSQGQEDPLEKKVATHSRRILWTEEPGGLQSMGSQRVPHYWVNNYSPVEAMLPNMVERKEGRREYPFVNVLVGTKMTVLFLLVGLNLGEEVQCLQVILSKETSYLNLVCQVDFSVGKTMYWLAGMNIPVCLSLSLIDNSQSSPQHKEVGASINLVSFIYLFLLQYS